MPKTPVHRGYRAHTVSGVHTPRKKGNRAATIFTKLDHPRGAVKARGRSKKG
jgi:hypothetical protein